MKPEDIGRAYNKLTQLWLRESFDMSNGLAQHHIALRFVKNRRKALDIGCGCTGRFIDLLLSEGFKPTGIDISAQMIDIARNKHPLVEFIHADICQYNLSAKYDFITAWDSIWHIPLAEQKHVLTKIINGLNVGGVFIFSFGGIAAEGFHTNDVMGETLYYSSLGLHGFLTVCIELGCIIRHLEFDQYPEVHAYLVVEKA